MGRRAPQLGPLGCNDSGDDPEMRKTLIVATLILLFAAMGACTTAEEQADLQTLNRLEEAGSDLSKPHEMEFFLYFPDEASANAAAADIREQGFSVQVWPPEDGSDWLCFATSCRWIGPSSAGLPPP